MTHRSVAAEIAPLTQAYLDGSLTDQEAARLHALLLQEHSVVDMLLAGLREDHLIRSVVAKQIVRTRGAEITLPSRRTVWWANLIRIVGAPLGVARAQRPALVCALAFMATLIVVLLTRAFGSAPIVTATDPKTGGPLLRRAGTVQRVITAALRNGDLLRTGSNETAIITYNREQTRLRLAPNTEVAVLDWKHGKRFRLARGKVDATVAHQARGKPMTWQTAQATLTVIGTELSLQQEGSSTTLLVIEGKVILTELGTTDSIQLTNGECSTVISGIRLEVKTFAGSKGKILRECWTNLEGVHVGNLTSDPRYPDHPTSIGYQVALDGPERRGTNYGERLRGYLYPPATGNYRFWISGTDSAQLWLSSDESAAKSRMIASVNLPVAPGQWDRYPWQASYPIKLEAGRRYYIEVLHKASEGLNGQCAVAWQIPSRTREIVAGAYLSPVIVSSKGEP